MARTFVWGVGGVIATLVQLALAQPTSAQQAAEAPSSTLEEVVVHGRYEFLSADTRGATGLPIAIEQVPQSISLITGDFLKAADLKTLSEIAEYTPGALNVGNKAGFGSHIKLRGFTGGRAIDGINVQGIPIFEPDNAIVDRLEIVKGPASVVYGVSSPGGLVNYVTKSATASTPDYLYAQLGMWDGLRVEGQLAGALDSDGRVRAIGVVVRDQADSFMNDVSHGTTTLYGGIDMALTDAVTASLHGGYQRFTRTAFDGIPTEEDGTPAPLPRSFFIGSKDIEMTTSVYHAEGNLTWHASDVLEFSLKGNFERADNKGFAPYSFGLEENGDIGLAVEKYDSRFDNFGVGASSIYRFKLRDVEGSFLSVSALYQDSERYQDWPYNEDGVGNIFNGQASLTAVFNSLLDGPFSPYTIDTDARTLTFGAQSVLRITGPLSVLLGASYAEPDLTQDVDGTRSNYSINSETSYRAGLTYEVVPGANLYVSYSESFNPQTRSGVGDVVLPPLSGSQYETGVKVRSPNGRLLLTGALFRIDQTNQSQYDQTVGGVDYYKALGKVQHKGFELEALGRITPQWQVNAGFAYLDPKITRDSDAAKVGKTETFLPKRTASVYTTYTLASGVLHGFSLGGGLRYTGSQLTALDGSTRDMPGYVLADATVGYSNESWLVQLNAHNLLDKKYFINNYQTLFYGNAVGDPANVSLSVRRNF